MHCDSWAGSSVAIPPVAWRELPWWMPGVSVPRVKFRHCASSPCWHHSQSGSPRGAHESQGFSTTRSPTRRVRTPGPVRSTRATTSCPSTCGNEISAVIGLSMRPFRNTCL